MTQEEKQLLLVDLCARIPYSQIVNINGEIKKLIAISNSFIHFADLTDDDLEGICDLDYCDVKPYLRPMSSMTEEEVKDLLKVHIKTKYGENSGYYKNLIRIERISKHDNNSWSIWIVFKNSYDECVYTTCFIIGRVTFETTINEIDWLNANHFDYRGLIEKGLAIEASKISYYDTRRKTVIT